MRVVFSKPALADLDEISGYLLANHPAIAPAVERRIRVVLGRYRIFHRVAADAVAIHQES